MSVPFASAAKRGYKQMIFQQLSDYETRTYEDLAPRCQGWITVSLSSILFSATLTADRNTHECTVENLASGDGGGCFQPIVHFLSAAQRFLHVFADVLGADEVRKFGLLDEL